MNKSIKTLVVGMLGVLLTTGAVATPAHAISGIDFLKQNQQNQQYQAQTQVQEMIVAGKTVALDGIVTVTEQALKYEGYSVVNGDVNKVVYVKDGQFLSGWVKDVTNWRYYDPETHFMLRNQVKVIDGKEYCFDFSGIMLSDKNTETAYYGVDGAKAGGVNSNCINTYNSVYFEGKHYTIAEITQLINEGKIKAKTVWGSSYGGAVTSGLNIYSIV